MSWLRIDDSFDSHPKILALKTDARRFTWMRVLIYTCRYRSPIVPDEIRDTIRAATNAFLNDCEKLGLIDRDTEGRRVVHDWNQYNFASEPDAEAAIFTALEANPDASANEIFRIVGGKRKLVLDTIKRYRTGTEPVPEGGTRYQAGTGSRVGARARPVPDPTNRGEEPHLGATPPLRDLDQPAESAERSPAGQRNGNHRSADEWFGEEPEPTSKTTKRKASEPEGQNIGRRPFNRKNAEAYVRNVAWQDPHPADALRATYTDIPDDDLVALVELALDLAKEGATA